MTLILGLGGLATEAAQRGDDRAAGLLRDAVEFLVSDAHAAAELEKARARNRVRQSRYRERHVTPVTSLNVTNVTDPSFSPGPPFPTQTAEYETTRAREAVEADAEMIERFTGMLAERMGADFSEIGRASC